MEIKRVKKDDISGKASAFYVRIAGMNVEEFGIPVDKEIDEREDYEYIVAYDDSHPVATCRIHEVDGETAKIERVVTLKSYRGKGVGRQIIEAAEDWIRERGIRHIVVTSRDEAVGFYEKLGYNPDYDRIRNESGAVFNIVYTEKYL